MGSPIGWRRDREAVWMVSKRIGRLRQRSSERLWKPGLLEHDVGPMPRLDLAINREAVALMGLNQMS
jgi:hypothetical protein